VGVVVDDRVARGRDERLPATEGLDQRLLFIGDDHRGVTLEVIAIQLPDYLLVIHVMPYALRRRSDG